jgi:hypothetical protein
VISSAVFEVMVTDCRPFGHAEHFDSVGEGARLDDNLRYRGRPSTAGRAGRARRLAAESQFQPPATSISRTATTAATRKKCLRITKGSGRRERTAQLIQTAH